MFRHQVEYDDLVAVNGIIILLLHLSLQSLCHLNHIRITEKISLQVLDIQLRFVTWLNDTVPIQWTL